MLPYLRLVRLPNVFTALADILAGGLIISATAGTLFSKPFLFLCGASASLYLSGMAFNDLADREEDFRVRPNRPIPSGAVSVRGAAVCGLVLMVGGIALAGAVNTVSLALAAILAVWILAYDFGSKGITVLGPFTLGLCRVTNMLLAMSAAPDFLERLKLLHVKDAPLAPALAVGIYAAGLTAFSAQEETGKRLRAIVLGWLFCGGGILLAALASPSPLLWLTVGPLTGLLLLLTWRLKQEGSPIAARNLVRAGVLGICALDAGMILGFGGAAAWPYAVGCLALLVPSLLLGKWLAQKEA